MKRADRNLRSNMPVCRLAALYAEGRDAMAPLLFFMWPEAKSGRYAGSGNGMVWRLHMQ